MSSRFARVAVLVCVLAAPQLSHAHSMGTVFSGPTDDDGMAVFWNPAAMAASTTSRFDLVANFAVLQAGYQRAGVDMGQGGRPFPNVSLVSLRPEPAIGLIIDKLWHKRLRLGFSLTVPSAAGAAWPETVTDATGQQVLGPTRYHVLDATIFHAFFQVGASLALHPTFAIGASVIVDFAYLSVRKHADLANQPGIRDILPCNQNPFGCESSALSAPVTLNGTGVAPGGSIGILWQPIKRLRIGVAYLSQVKVTTTASLTVDASKLNAFAQQFLPTFQPISVNGNGSATVTVPMRVHAGVAVDVHPRVEVSATLQWINSSATEIIDAQLVQRNSSLVPSTLTIPAVHNDGWDITARVVGKIRERWKIGFSIEYDTKTVPEAYMTPSNLDFDTISLNLGANVRLWRKLYLGASFSQFIVLPRTITKSVFENQNAEPYSFPDPTGVYSGNAERLGLDLTARF